MKMAVNPVYAEAALCRRQLSFFVRRAWQVVEPSTDLIWNAHIDAICKHLEAVTRAITNQKLPPHERWEGPEIRRLLINVPPGHMKSLLTSVFWPAWMWVRWPWLRYLFSSYGLDLAIRDSLRTRDLIKSDWYQNTFEPNWKLKQDADNKQVFVNTQQGFRHCVSVGSGATGNRGDLVVCDDPLNVISQRSEIKLKEAAWWWDKAMSSRLNDPRHGARVMIMQRLHENDPSAHCLSKQGTGAYVHLCLPSEFEVKRKCVIPITGYEDWRTQEGELLFPHLFNKRVLAEAKSDMGSDTYAGQHQQRPAPAEGGFFRRSWMRSYQRAELPSGEGYYFLSDPVTGRSRRVLESDCWTLIVADTAVKEKTMNDYWVALVWHIERNLDQKGRQTGCTMILRDLWRQQCNAPEGEARLKELNDRYDPDFFGIEDKVSGTAIIQRFIRDGLRIKAIKADKDKVTRASTAQVWFESAKVWLPQDAPWLNDYVAELTTFPNGSNDDQVDATAHSVNFANNRDLWIKPKPKKFAHYTLGAIAGHDEV